MEKLDIIIKRVDSLESKIELIQSNQIDLELQLKAAKDVITQQQKYIERQEILQRNLNLIVSNVSEKDIKYEGNTLVNDMSKIEALCGSVYPDYEDTDIISVTRLGKASRGSDRPLKVTFRKSKCRDFMLFNQEQFIRQANRFPGSSKIYFNKDLPILSRNEDKRLREEARKNRLHANNDDKVFIKNGKLYKNHDVIDQFDIANQLFRLD